MKTDQILSNISRQVRPKVRRPTPGFVQCCRTSHLAAFNQSARPQRPPFKPHYPLRFALARYNSTSTTSLTSAVAPEPPAEPVKTPTYELTFTCKPCLHRSTHRVSHQGYHHGTVIITCHNCKNRHVMADHLKIFEDKAFTVEDLMREKGGRFRRGRLGEDMEFWNDEIRTEEGTV
jgi:protein import protein ZIM17